MPKKTTRNNIKKLLDKNPELCKVENYRLAVWEYWSKYEKAKWGVTKEAWVRHLTLPEDIKEAIEEYLFTFNGKDNIIK